MVQRIEQRAAALFHVVGKRIRDIDFRTQRHRVDAVPDQFRLIHRGLSSRRDTNTEIITSADSCHPRIERRKHDVEQAAARFCSDLTQSLNQLC